MKRADLHVHTTHSDGMMAPEEVVEYAERKGLQAIAITDHDRVSAIDIAQKYAEKKQLEIIPGVEISTLWQKQEIHILGYWIDVDDPELLQLLENQRNVRHLRNQMMIQKLQELGISITLEEVMACKKDDDHRTVGRPHIAEVLIEKGVVRSMKEAFDRYLGKEGLAYLTPERISPMEAIRVIRKNGGVAVMAHPGLYQMDHIIPSLVKEGLIGIEISHPDHTKEDERRYREIAVEHHLVMTAGSDFHGEREGKMYHADLGTCTAPYERVVQLKQRARNIR